MLSRVSSSLVSLFVLGLSLAAVARAQDVERLHIHGSNTLGSQLMPALVESWLGSIGYTRIEQSAVSGSVLEIRAERDGLPLVVEIGKRGSTRGFHDLVAGEAELAMMARAPSTTERNAGWQLGNLDSPDQQFVIALDGARVIVPVGSALQRLDTDQLRDMLTGRLASWRALGGGSQPIHLHCVLGGGLQDYLRDRLTNGAALRGCNTRHRTLRDVGEAVANDPLAIGLVALSTPGVVGTRALAISDHGIPVAPSAINVRSEDYPLVQRYRVYGGQMMSALGRSLALYLVGAEAQRIVAAQGLVSMQLPDAASVDTREAAPAYRQATAAATRLAVSIHFDLESLTSMFDGSSERDLDRVVRFMHQPQLQGHALAVVGFANPDPANKVFSTIDSNERADAVARYLTKHGVAVKRSRGMGATRPLAASSQPDSRRRNERVELWLL